MKPGYASRAVKTDAGGLLLEVYQVVTGFHVDAMIPPSAAVQVISAPGRCGKSALRTYMGVVWGGVDVGVGPKPRPWRSQGSEGIATYMTQWAFSPHSLLEFRALSHCDLTESLKTCLGLWFMG